MAVSSLHDTQPGLLSGQAHVWLAWTDACGAAGQLAAYRQLLNEQEIEQLERLAFDHLKNEYLVTRALCRTTLSRYSPLHPAEWLFRSNGHGRPEIALESLSSNLRFNLSNTRDLVACIVALDVDVGIDVEEVGRHRHWLEIAERFFSKYEIAALKALPESDRRELFVELWTLKESYIKARGLGLSIPLEQFSFRRDHGEIRIAFDDRLKDEPAHWQFLSRDIGHSHRMAVAIHRKNEADFSVLFNEVVPLQRFR